MCSVKLGLCVTVCSVNSVGVWCVHRETDLFVLDEFGHFDAFKVFRLCNTSRGESHRILISVDVARLKTHDCCGAVY